MVDDYCVECGKPLDEDDMMLTDAGFVCGECADALLKEEEDERLAFKQHLLLTAA